jgi:hypothetical protein
MPTLRVTDSPASVVIQVGEVLTVVAPTGSSAYVVDKYDLSPADTVTSETTEFGPYSDTNHVTVTCTAGAVSFSVAQAASAEGGTFASQAEAEAGEATDKYMSPLRVAQAIEALAPEGGTIGDGTVTLAKMANLAQDQVIGRTTASTGVPETFTVTAAARTVLDDTTVAAMVNTLGGATSTGTGGIARAASPTFTGTPAAPTASAGTNTTQIATTAFVRTEVAALVAAAPGTLDTLDELAAALGDDANFAATMTTALAAKAPLVSPIFTTPSLGVATATSINGTAIPSSATLATADAPVTLSTGTNLTRASHANRLLICDTAATHVIQDDTTGGFAAGDLVFGINTSSGVVVFAGESTGTASTVTAGPGLTLSVPPGQEFSFSRTAAHTWVGGAADTGLPINSQSTAYTAVWADRNKTLLHPTEDDNARTFTIPANSSVPYPLGTTLTFVNQINTVTIAITTDTLTLAGAGSTGSRTLAANGVATALKVSSTGWVINGTGIS